MGEAAVTEQPGDRSISQRCRPRRSEDSMPGRAIRLTMSRSRSQEGMSAEWQALSARSSARCLRRGPRRDRRWSPCHQRLEGQAVVGGRAGARASRWVAALPVRPCLAPGRRDSPAAPGPSAPRSEIHRRDARRLPSPPPAKENQVNGFGLVVLIVIVAAVAAVSMWLQGTGFRDYLRRRRGER